MKTSMSMLRVVCCWCLCLSLCTMGLAKETITQSGVVKPATQEQLTQEKNKDRVAAKLNAAGPAEVKVKPNPKTLLEVKLAEPTRSSVQEPKAIVKSMPKALGKKMPKTIVTSVDRGQKVKEAAVLNSKLQLRETAVVNSKVGYDEKLQFKNKLQLSDKLHLSKKVALGNKIELRDAGEKINSAGAYRFKILQDKRANTSKPNKVNASHYRDRVLSTYSVNTSDTNSNTASRDGNVTFDIDGVEGCGFLSVTGTFDGWSGWGANSDTGMTAFVPSGDHEFIILCVDTSNDGWWYDIWGNSSIINPPFGAGCDNGNDTYTNYVFTVGDEDMVVSYCAGTCDAVCAAEGCADGTVEDCAGDGDCAPGSWIGDGWCDGADQPFGYDLSCYDNDGGDCAAADDGGDDGSADDGGAGCADGEVEDCSGDGDCAPASWVGDGWCDGEDQPFGYDLTCYDNDNGDCFVPPSNYTVTFDLDGLDDCGFVSVTGDFSGWDGWGATTDTGLTIGLPDGSYEFVILCVDTSIDGWWDNIWGNSTIYNAPVECDVTGGEWGNYGFTVGGSDLTVELCAGTCDAECAAEGCADGTVDDCAGDGDCAPLSWVGDGWCDGADQPFGYDLSCYDNDGGDCAAADDGGDDGSADDGGSGCVDCVGNDCTGFESWVGDGWCDDGAFGLYFNCDEFDCDAGDCDCSDGDDGSADDGGAGCAEGEYEDCSGDGDCAPGSWVGDGWCDGTDQPFGYDLTCYDNDGGDCAAADDGGDDGSGDDGDTGCADGSVEDCSGDGDCCAEFWIGDGWCDGADQPFGCDLSCYDNDGGDCAAADDGGDDGSADDGGAGCDAGTVEDCAGDGDCAPESWIGDGWCDGADQPFGYDLSCYDNDGGDCAAADDGGDDGSADDGGTGCPDGTVEDCSGDGDCCADSWIGDGWCDGTDQAFGCDLLCYDEDGGDCATTDDGGADDGGSASCESCEFDWSAYGSECCDTAFAEFGIDCATLESNYGWDCTGCACPGDLSCEDQGLVTCEFGTIYGEECGQSEGDCLSEGECAIGEVLDCADSDCCPETWIGDGFMDCEDQAFGCDLTCYDNDGGDCEMSADDGGEDGCLYDFTPYGAEDCDAAWTEFGISCADLEANYGWNCSGCECPGDGAGDDGSADDGGAGCDAGTVEDCAGDGDCAPESWIGDGWCDGTDQPFGYDLTCYDNDGGDCAAADDGGADDGGDDSCLYDYSEFGSENCDTAYYDFGIDCATLESVYAWDCSGCACPGDAGDDGSADDGGTGCDAGTVEDCAGDGDCAPESWVGDGWCDGTDQPFGYDLTCYDNDGGDCAAADDGGDDGSADDGGTGCDAGTVEDCSGDGDCCAENWIGDGWCDGEDQAFGCDLSCYDNDGGDCGVDCDIAWDMCLATLADYDAANGTDYYGACSAADCTGGVGGSCDGEVVPFLSDECGFYAYQYIEGNCPDQCSGGSDDGGAGCPEGTVEDCSGDGDCCAASWIGDGFEDCEDQAFGCDLTCYDNDGGDCAAGDDGSADDGGGSEDCASCEFDWSNYGSECCDTAWAEFGIDCATLESVYGWDCAGCACPGDAAAVCGDGVCSGDETCETCEVDCGVCGECEEGFVLDCADFDCCPESWIGDGFLDCEDQAFGCDLTCYDNDGGDCYVAPTCEEQGLVECPDGVCADSLDECPELDCTMAGGNSSWLGDAFCDTANNIPECGFDSGDCCPGECAATEAAGCPDNPTGCWSTISCGDCETCIDESSPDLADGGECSEFQVPGCTDASACNYNEEAEVDDGTCFYAGEQEDGSVVLTDCDGTCFDSSLLSWIGDGWCDDGAFGVDFVCAEYDCDGADCGDAAGDAGECGGTACLAGDVNGDDTANVQDIVLIVGYILDGVAEFDLACADMNGDGLVNVQDVVLIVGGILDGRTTSDATDAKLNINDGFVSLKANGFIGAVQMTLSHDAGFAINLTDKAMVADYRTNGNSTTLIVIAPEGDYLFDATGEFTFEEVMVYNSEAEVSTSIVPNQLALSKAYPNPFNPSTSLSIALPADGFVSISVYNVMGQQVDMLHSGNMSAGEHNLTWNASNMTSGVYFVRAESSDAVAVQKVMLMK